MHWFFIAIISPFLSSVIHHIDKYILSKLSKEPAIGSLIIFSSLVPGFILPIILAFRPNILSLSGEFISLLLFGGILSALSLLFYFYALEEEETSVIAPMFQLIPIFGYFLGIAVLQETLDLNKILASLIVILGASMLSFEIQDEGGFRFKLKPTLLMIGASLFLAINDVLFKKVAISGTGYLSAIFWSLAGYVVFGLALLCFAKNYRQSFKRTTQNNGSKFVSLNLFNELLQNISVTTFSFALLLAPIALVMLVDSYQPVFVLVIGIVMTKYFPKIVKEKISPKHLFHKVVAISIIVIGSIFVYS
jgi:uncharacterized membrane protein